MGKGHTPGPWFWTESKEGEAGELRGPNCNTVASPQVDIGDYGLSAKCWVDVSIADAQLIAAAPDLLEALKSFEAHYPMGVNSFLDDAYRSARAAIAKATDGAGLVPGKDER